MDLLMPKIEMFTNHDTVIDDKMCDKSDEIANIRQITRNSSRLKCTINSSISSSSNNNKIESAIVAKKYKKKRQQCPKCPVSYSKREYLSKHMKNEHNIVLEKKRPGRQSSFPIHENDPRPYKCDQCLKEYTKSKHLARHKRTHLETKRCNECNEICSNYADHMLKKHGIDLPRPFECDICKKTYRTKTHIQSHMRIHRSASRIFCCAVCPKKFCFGTELRKHVKTHSQNRSVICDICGDAFKSSDTLKCHMRRHTGERPYKCSQCPRAFSTSNSLDIHFRTHTGERPFECEFCKKRFSDSSTLLVHKRLHTNENPYMCHLCGRRTKQASNLRSHYKHFHKNNDISGRQIRLNSRIFNRFTQNEIDAQLEKTGDLMALLERGLQEYHREEMEKNSQIEKALEIIIAPKMMQSTSTEVQAIVNVKQEHVETVSQMNATTIAPLKRNLKLENSNGNDNTIMTESSLPMAVQKSPLKIESVFIDDEMCQISFDDVKREDIIENDADFDNDDWQNDNYIDASDEPLFGIMKYDSLIDNNYTKESFKTVAPKCDQDKDEQIYENLTALERKKSDESVQRSDVEIKSEQKNVKSKIAVSKAEMERCIPCNRKFHDMSKHWIQFHSGIERPYECFICHKDYKRHEHLKYHMKTHGDERNYICHVCGDAFFLSNDLRKHIMNRHQVERPYKCTHQQCNKCFKNQHALNVHMRTHSGIKPFVCAQCSEAFSALSSLRIHERKHTGDKPYVCKFCKKAFADCSTHKQHERIHTGEKPYRCNLCNRRTAQAGNLKSHYRHYHKIIVKSVSMYVDQTSIPFSEEIQRNPYERAHGIAAYPLFDPTRRIEE